MGIYSLAYKPNMSLIGPLTLGLPSHQPLQDQHLPKLARQ